ncbi:MAG: hypothetical protein ACOCXH_05745 [Cyclobacteriaceae bacterium]
MFKLYIIVLLILPIASIAQDGLILYDTNDKIQLKWYHPNLLTFPGGCKVYKYFEEKSEWHLVSEVYKKDIASYNYDKDDSTMQFFLQAADYYSSNENKDFAYLNILVKSFQSNNYADYLGIYYEDKINFNKSKVKYKVTYNNFGQEVVLGETDFILINNSKAPDYDLIINNKNGKNRLKWRIDDNEFYGVDVYRRIGNESSFTKLNTHPVMVGQKSNEDGEMTMPEYFFEDDVKEKNITYEYKIAGKGYFEKDKPFSEPVQVFVKEDKLPFSPRNLKRELVDNTIYLKWENPLDTSYFHLNIYYSTKSDGPFAKLNSSPLPDNIQSFQVKGEEGKGYYYYVTSENEYGNESRSNKIFVEVADKSPPAPPRNVIIKADTGYFQITWEKNEEQDLIG